jgi:murein DD-endopeptidase MepM/ murein hydrolase activator NlpD
MQDKIQEKLKKLMKELLNKALDALGVGVYVRAAKIVIIVVVILVVAIMLVISAYYKIVLCKASFGLVCEENKKDPTPESAIMALVSDKSNPTNLSLATMMARRAQANSISEVQGDMYIQDDVFEGSNFDTRTLDANITAAQLIAGMNKPGVKMPAWLPKYADAYITTAAKVNVNKTEKVSPILLAAITFAEVGYADISNNNVGGIMGGTGSADHTVFANVEDSIQVMANTMRSYYDGKHGFPRYTLGDIRDEYTPIGATNDPNGLNKSWLPNVAFFMKQLGYDAGVSNDFVATGKDPETHLRVMLQIEMQQTAVLNQALIEKYPDGTIMRKIWDEAKSRRDGLWDSTVNFFNKKAEWTDSDFMLNTEFDMVRCYLVGDCQNGSGKIIDAADQNVIGQTKEVTITWIEQQCSSSTDADGNTSTSCIDVEKSRTYKEVVHKDLKEILYSYGKYSTINDPAKYAEQVDEYLRMMSNGKQVDMTKIPKNINPGNPLPGTLAAGTLRITGPYGEARGNGPHNGIDFGAPIGTPVYAVEDGVVEFAGRAGGFGNWVVILTDSGIEDVYGHVLDNDINCAPCQPPGFPKVTTDYYSEAMKIPVTAGQRVIKGDIVAYLGHAGQSTGPHLHFGVSLGRTPEGKMNYVDPNAYYQFK